MAQLIVAHDEIDLAQRAAGRLTELIGLAVATRGRARVSLTGGTTPRRLYGNLADARHPWHGQIPWSQVHLFWGDERHVPPDHPDSNYGMAKATLLEHVPVPADQVHRIRAEMPDARDAAADYERVLDGVASASGRTDPLFDIMLLGIGEDAHVASIFPGSELLTPDTEYPSTGRRVAAVKVPRSDAWRITLTPGSILNARAIVVLVAGANKAVAVKAALQEPLDVMTYPAQLLRAAGDRIEWFTDRAAAALL